VHTSSPPRKEEDVITTGQSLTNPVTGETLVFRTTSADTNGEAVVVECFVEPDGAVAAAHVHPAQEERFEVLSGELEFRVGKKTVVAGPGDRVVVPAGTPHRFRSTGAETAHFVCEVKPALGFEELIETMFSLAADGKVNRKGMPNPLRLAVIARHHFGDVRLPFPPAWLQRLGLAFGAPLGRLFGYRPTYQPAAPDTPEAFGI
jgi:mannose-6-phosphate isomerase-like protein (cupin superfamily)